jgi:hypothetical protein
VQRAVLEAERHQAPAAAVVVHEQIEREVLVEELDLVAQRLLEQRVEQGMPGAVGGGAGAIGLVLAVLGRLAAEGALVDLALGRARERHAVVLELDHRRRGVLGHVLDRVLVAQPVRALDRVVHVKAPVVRAHVAERGVDAALGRDRVRAGRIHLGDAGGPEARLDHADRGAQARAAGADDQAVVLVIDDRVSLGHGISFRARL